MPALRIGASLAAAAAVGLVALFPFEAAGLLRRPHDWPPAMYPLIALAVVTTATVGLLIARRRPTNPIAWILVPSALAMAALSQGLFLDAPWATHVANATWPLLYAWPIAIAYVFPDGRLLSRRWRRLAIAAAASFLGFMTFALLDPSESASTDDGVRNPLAHNAAGEWISHHGLAWLWVPFWFGMLASLFGGAFAIASRVRRSTGVERLQVLWLAWAAALFPLTLVVCGLSAFVVTDVLDFVVAPALLLGQTAVAAAIGVAVARYRLYAIETIVNRTLVYATVTLALVATYVAVVLGLGVAAGRGSASVTAVATLAVALAFRPLRARVQAAVDRRFDRQRYAGVLAVEAFEHEVREGRSAPEEVGAVVARALGDPRASLVFWLPASETYADAAGAVLDPLPDDGRARSVIGHEDERTAVLLHDPALLERPRLLEGILTAAALSAEIARLRVEVRLQLQEVQASRARIVEAGYEERRRLERDLHDGAQQRLVSLGVQIRRMQRTLPKEARILGPALDGIVDEIASAVADLRRIAAGVRPARLDDGLAAALRDLAREAPVPVVVDAKVERATASVEAAAYFVACEALTNAVKHASASRVAVRASRDNGTLLLTVADDGVGGAVARRGSGLAGLSPRGGGTRIEVALPCES